MVSWLKNDLDTFVNLAVLVCIVALIGFFGYQWFSSQTQQSSYKEEFAEAKVLAEVPNLNEKNEENN